LCRMASFPLAEATPAVPTPFPLAKALLSAVVLGFAAWTLDLADCPASFPLNRPPLAPVVWTPPTAAPLRFCPSDIGADAHTSPLKADTANTTAAIAPTPNATRFGVHHRELCSEMAFSSLSAFGNNGVANPPSSFVSATGSMINCKSSSRGSKGSAGDFAPKITLELAGAEAIEGKVSTDKWVEGVAISDLSSVTCDVSSLKGLEVASLRTSIAASDEADKVC